MTISSLYKATGVDIHYGDPLWKTDRESHIGSLGKVVESYGHDSRAVGGYYSAQSTINAKQIDINEWLEYGIGRWITAYNPGQQIIWEGFVNKITANLGPLTFSVGPLLSVANRVFVEYSQIDTSTDPPTFGIRDTTGNANNTDSQELYGIIEKKYSIQGATTVEAEQLRDSYIADPTRAFPATSRKSNITGGSGPSMSLRCLGLWHWLGTYIYNNTGVTGTQNLDAKIEAILGDEPNGIFSTDYGQITENTTPVKQQEDQNRYALTIMKRLNGVGDPSFNRYNMGFYQNQQFVYNAAPTTIQYEQRLANNEGITEVGGNRVDPWDVNPAEWLFFSDFMVGRVPPVNLATLRADLRAGFIETVTYTAPYELRVNGEKVNEPDQMLARLGLGGLGA